MRINWSKVWDYAAWISFAYILIYFLLRALGIWNSPLPADVVVTLGFGVLIGRYLQKFEHIIKDVDILKRKMLKLERRFPEVFD